MLDNEGVPLNEVDLEENGNVPTSPNMDSIDGTCTKKDCTRVTFGSKEIKILTEHENTSHGILEVAGLQQTVNIAVFFVKADLKMNFLYHMTCISIIVSIVAQVVLASLVAAKIWIRKCEESLKKKRDEETFLSENDQKKMTNIKKRLRKLDFIILLLMLFITILTTILLATSGMTEVDHDVSLIETR